MQKATFVYLNHFLQRLACCLLSSVLAAATFVYLTVLAACFCLKLAVAKALGLASGPAACVIHCMLQDPVNT